MQLTINILDNSKSDLMMEILAAINKCKCIVLEIRCSQFTGTKAGYLLIGGNWNHIAKLENSLETLNKQTDVKITKFRIDEDNSKKDLLPYALETISLNKKKHSTANHHIFDETKHPDPGNLWKLLSDALFADRSIFNQIPYIDSS